jgi:hypothetical protein
MLVVDVPLTAEGWDDKKQEFVVPEVQTLRLEHSLVSLSKWESKWHKPFLSQDTKTHEETIDYIRCMTITQNIPSSVYEKITDNIIDQVNKYIEDSMTATWFKKQKGGKKSSEQVTSELIYYWMLSLNIPFECEKWHLNRLLTLIQICDVKGSTGDNKMSKRETLNSYKALNAARRKKYNTKG